MNNLQVFKNEIFGEIRTVEINGKPYFVANDIAKALGYSRPRQAIIDHCKGSIKMALPSEGGIQETNIIPEGDIYRLTIKSQLPSAEKFESWVFDDILPSIRKHGMYATDELLDNPDLLIKVATALKEERERNKQLTEVNTQLLVKSEQDKPKVEFFDTVADSKSAVAIGDVAKVIGIKGLGRNKLFELLREKNVLMRDNQPYQRYIDSGYFRVVEQKYTKPDGETVISFKTLVYQKGVDYIRKLVA